MGARSFLEKTKPLLHEFNILPIAFIDESVILDEKSSHKLYKQVILPHTVVVYGQYVLLTLGAGLVLCSLTLFVLWVSGRHEVMSYRMFFDDAEVIN